MKQPFLVGNYVYLRGLRLEDVERNYVNWLNDAEVCQYNSHHVFPFSMQEAEEYARSTFHSRNSLVLAIILKKGDLHIGNITLKNIDNVSRRAEFAIVMGEKKLWGRGYSKEAAFLMVNHGFMEMNLHRIYCGTSIDNISMQKLAEYLGMKKEGRRRDDLFKNGQYRDIVEYGVLKNEFNNKFKEGKMSR